MSPYRPHSVSRSARPKEPSSLAAGFFATAKFTGFLAIVGAAGWFFLQSQIHSKLRETIQSKCDEALVGTNITSTIGNAQFFDGRGMLLSNVQAQTGDISLTAYETFLAMPTHTTELVTGSCDVEGITMRRLQIEVVRKKNQMFDVSQIVSLIKTAMANRTQTKLIPIAIQDSKLHVVDEVSGIQKTISDITIRATPIEFEGRSILEVSVSASSAEIQRISLNGFLDPSSGEWRCQLDLNSATMRTDLFALVPRQFQKLLNPVRSFSGRIDGAIQAEGNFRSAELRWFEGQGTVSQLSLDDTRIPAAIQNGFSKFHFNQETATLSEISGHLGTSPFAAHYHQKDLLNPSGWQLIGRLDQFNFDGSRRMIEALPEGGKRFASDFQPRGKFDFQFDISFDGKRIRKTVDSQISDLTFNFNKFPYPVSGCKGVAKWVDDRIEYDLRNLSTASELSAKGVVINPGMDATWKCDLKVERGSLPFDEKLQIAIDANPSLAKVVRAFNAHGWISGSGTLEKQIPRGDVRKAFDIELLDVTMRHNKFPYTIEGVKGKVKSLDKSFWFEQLTGGNGIGKILCNGRWNPKEGLKARYVCNNIQLDERLRTALKTELKEVWDGFRPRGTVEMMTVDMTLPPGAHDANLVLDATLHGEADGIRKSNLSIYPTWFPYELNDLAGRILVGDGKIALRDFRGRHRRTDVVCKGDGSYSNTGWDMRLSDLWAMKLRADEPLLSALPESLARPIEYMKFDGLLNVTGEMTLAGQYRKPAVQFANQIPTTPAQVKSTTFVQQATAVQQINSRSVAPKVSMGWDLRFDLNNAEMFLGIPVENVFGMFKLLGQYDGENVECRGSVDIDSLTIYDAQITKLKGPVWFDNYQALAGGMINQLPSGNNQTPSIIGEMYGGVVKLDAAISSDREGRFAIQTSLADGNLKQFCNEFSPSLENVEGHAFVGLRMQGDASGTDSCRGNGVIELTDAKIYELPPVFRLLKLFSIRRVDDVAFDSGKATFAVNGENIDINRMEFNGDAISLIGNGRMTMDHDLDLNFYSVMGRNKFRIPLFHELYHLGSQKFLWIKIGGTCQNPTMKREVLPELNESVRQLFPRAGER